MATRHFDNASLGRFPESLLPVNLWMSGHAAPLRLVGAQQQTLAGRRGVPAGPEAGNIGRCIRWAFALEGGAALLIYAAWVLLHSLR